MGYLSTSSSLFAGILAYWKLDDISWTDSSSNGRNLTLVGSLSNPAGLIGNSASGFSGNDYLITPSGLAPLSGKRTYSCWVYFNSNDIGYQIIWGQGGTEDYQSTYPFIIETNNQITSWFTTENGYWTNGIDSGIIPDTDVWYHLVLTFDGSIGILYVNGTSVGSSEYSGSILAPDIDRFLFGRYYTDINYNDNEFNPLALDGKIDEVGVWDRALTQEEITTLYNSGAGKFLNTKISIKKQNLGGGKISLYKKPFAPNALQGLSLWLKADAGVTLSGSDVTAWADQSESGFSANGNVTNGINPTLVSNVKNGKPILRFGNSNNPTILRTAPTTFGNNGEFTIFTVHKYDNTNNTWAELISKGDLATAEGSQFAISPRFISSDPTTSAFGVMGSDYNWSFLYQEPASTSWSIVCGIQSITNNSQKYFVNGSLASESASVSAINQLNIAIGIGNGGSDSTPWSAEYGGFKGDLAEVIFYNRALTISERQQVEAYLNAKYNIY